MFVALRADKHPPDDKVITLMVLLPQVRALKLLSCLLSLLVASYGVAQVGEASQWQRDPLLSPLLIQQMVTDASGFRWVATDEGVYRYDGNEIIPLKSLVRRGPRLGVEFVSALAIDRAGRLWIGSEFGLTRFDPATGHLLAVRLPLRLDERPEVNNLLHDPRTDRVWVGYGAGTIAVLAATQPQHPLFPVSRVTDTDSFFTAETGGQGIWLVNDRAMLYHLAPDGRVKKRVWGPTQMLPVPGTWPQRFFSSQGLYVIDSAYQLKAICLWPRLLPNLANKPYVTDSTLDIVVEGQWLHVADVRGVRPRLSISPITSLPGQTKTRSCLLERDVYGVWWRFERGYRGCYKQRQVRRVVEPMLQANGAAVGSARLITRLPDGRLLVSTYSGFFAQAADSPMAPLRPLLLQQLGVEYHAGVWWGLLADPIGRFAVVADEISGVARLDLARRQVRYLDSTWITNGRREPYTLTRAFALLHDRAGQLWVGGQTGLFLVSPDALSLRRFAHERTTWPLHKLDITGLAEDPTNRALWVCTNGGLFWLRPESPHQMRAFTVGGSAGRRLPTDALMCVAAAGAGRAWVGTRDQGLLLVDARAGVVRQISLSEGLPSHTIASVMLDREGTVWVGTYAGLVRYDPDSGQLAVFGEAEGLQDPELNRRSAFADADGSLWFGGVGGVYRVQPSRAATMVLPRPPQLLLTALSTPVGATEAVQYFVSGLRQRVTLAADRNAFVELRLALTDFFAPSLVRYAYRLHPTGEEMPTAWINTPRRLVLRNLAPGDYEVEIRAETASGQPTGNNLRIPLHVEASWWQWPLLWVLVAALLVALGYGIYWLRLRRVLREAQRRAELAANLHDEVGALLTRVTMLAEVLRDHYQPMPEVGAGRFNARHALDRLLYNSRAAVQTMRDVVWGIDSQADSVASLLYRMHDHLDQTATAAGLVATFNHAGLSEKTVLPASTRQHLFLIFKEAVTNTARHARTATEISVLLDYQGGKLVLEVGDNGQSRYNAPSRPNGMGLRNMAHRAQALGAELRTGSHPDGRPGYWVQLTIR